MKKYKAKTDVSINVTLQNGRNTRISFSPLTAGGSVFYTDDKEIQDALERHYKFGKLFTLDGILLKTPVKEKKRSKANVIKGVSAKPSARTDLESVALKVCNLANVVEVLAAEDSSGAEGPGDSPSESAQTQESIGLDESGNPADDFIDAAESDDYPDESDNEESDDDFSDEESDDGLTVMTFTDPSAAKDYLCEKYNISRTKIKTQEAIAKTALAYGIEIRYE